MRAALIGIVLSGCILQDVSLDGKDCPCASGYVCDDETAKCVRMLTPRDAGMDAGPEDATEDAGEIFPDAAPLPECARDTECPPTEICVASMCEPGCSSTGCNAPLVCDPSGRCFSSDMTCDDEADCNPPHQVCIDGECAPGCAVGGGSCTQNLICDPSSGFCEAAPECNLIEPCPDREFTCADDYCIRRCDAPGAPPCLGDSTCNQLGRCAGTKLGDGCSGDAECTSGLCYSTADPPRTFCATPCGRTSDCPLTFGCLPTGNGYRVCAPDSIFTQVSFATPSGEACTNPNNTCQSGTCDSVALTCTEHCGTDDHCAQFGTDCVVRQQMINGNTVFSEECIAGPGPGVSGLACGVNSDCASGLCNKYESVCADLCCTDSDCPPSQNCLVYDLNNQNVITVCQPSGAGTTQIGMSCNNANDCESGTCTPESPLNLGGPKICSVRCCTHADCSALPNGFCHPIPGVLPGTEAATCFPGS